MVPLSFALWALADAQGATLVTCGALPADGTCYVSLIAAVNDAAPGDVIELEAGLYHEAIEVTKDLTLRGRSGHLLIGPFDPALKSMIKVRGATLTLEDIDATAAAVRVIEATDGATLILRGVQLASYGTVDHGGVILASDSAVRFEGGVVSAIGPGRAVHGGLLYLSDSELDDGPATVELSGGVALENGGALVAVHTKGDREIVDIGMRFEGNRSGADGGAVAAVGVDLIADGAWFVANEAGWEGGALHATDASIDLTYGTFDRNESLAAGGAIASLEGRSLVVREVSFVDNRADGAQAGAIYATGPEGSVAQLEEVLFVGNEAHGDGGAVATAGWVDLEIVRSRFCRNVAAHGGAVDARGAEVDVRNSQFYANQATTGIYGGGGALYVLAYGEASVVHNHFIENAGAGGSAITLLYGTSAAEIADNLFAWNAGTPTSDPRFPGASTVAIDGADASVHHNLFWANTADAEVTGDPPDAGLRADPRLVRWELEAACEAGRLASDTQPGWPSWYSPLRDGGGVGLDPDGTAPDIGAFGGPDAEPSAFTLDWDQDGYGQMYDCSDDPLLDERAPGIHPQAVESPYDGVDQNCDWRSDFDADHDGFDSADHGGDDCDDGNSTRYPGAAEIPYDGVDQDCDGVMDDDLDDDGWSRPTDCDDADPTIYPGAPDEDPARDRDCDGHFDVAQPLRPRACAVSPLSGPWALLALLLGLGRRR